MTSRLFRSWQGMAVPALAFLVSLSSAAAAWKPDERLWSAPWSWTGPGATARAGYAVASGGDLNGDGIDDVVCAAPFDAEGGERGSVYVVFGSALGWRPELTLSGPGIARFKGEAVGDHPGWSLAIVPSVNGDAFDDVVIGAPDNDQAGQGAGKVYVVFGKASGWAQDVSLATSDASFLGEGPGHKAGLSVASAGDVNGDGLGDFVVGAPLAPRGRTYLVLGTTTGWANSVSLADADGSFLGELDVTGMSQAGFCVSGVHDLNGDNRDEILIGAPKYTPDWDAMLVGKAYLILGRSSGWVQGDTLSHADKSFLGASQGDEYGRTLGGVGDVDGDGRGDFLISATGGTGSVYLFRGVSFGLWGQNTAPSEANSRIIGAYVSTGNALAGLGDVNGDPYDDFAIGAPDYGAGFGKAYAVLGRAAAGWPPEIDIETVEGGWQGVGHKDWAGRAVAGGDINHDGLADLIIGVDGSPFAGFDAGMVYAVPSNYGADDTPPATVSGFHAQVDLVDSSATIVWNPVTIDENGNPEETLFYRVLRYRYPSPVLRAQLPAVLSPQHGTTDLSWVPWSAAQSDTTAFYDQYDYYLLLAIDATGNASAPTARLSVFQVPTELP